MAQSLDGAIKDFIQVMKSKLKPLGVIVSTEVIDQPNKSMLVVSVGALIEEFGFGQVKRTQSLALTLSVVKSKETATEVSSLCRIINDIAHNDRRRSGNAQTTMMTEWTLSEDDGRTIVTLTSTADIRSTEPCT